MQMLFHMIPSMESIKLWEWGLFILSHIFVDYLPLNHQHRGTEWKAAAPKNQCSWFVLGP